MAARISESKKGSNSARRARFARAKEEYECLCASLCEQLSQGSIPPDEAYWWTRIAIEEAGRLRRHTPA